MGTTNQRGAKEEKVTTEEFLIEMKSFFENINELKVTLEEQIKETECARNDLLHELELANLNAVEMTKVAKTLKKVLKSLDTHNTPLRNRLHLILLIFVLASQIFLSHHQNLFL